MNWTKLNLRILTCGANDVGSAVAYCLFQAGYAVVIHEVIRPATTRRKMAFADAVFYGSTILDGIESKRLDELSTLGDMLTGHKTIPLVTKDFSEILEALHPILL